MAGTTKRRARRAAKRVERQRRAAVAVQTTPHRRPGDRPQPPLNWWPDEPEGGAGVREPRRPRPGLPAGAMALEEPDPEPYLELTH